MSDLSPHSDDPAAAGEFLVDAAGDPELAALLDRSRLVLGEPPDDLTMQRHLRAMKTMKTQKAPAARGAGRGTAGYRIAGAAVAAGFALVATLAGLGSLPAPAQQVMSDAAERVGFSLPEPARHAPGLSRAPGITKQMPTFDQPPGHELRDRFGRGGFPKPDDRPGAAGPPQGVPGLEGRDERPGRDARPAQPLTPGGSGGSVDEPAVDGTRTIPEQAPEDESAGDDGASTRAPVTPRGPDTPPPSEPEPSDPEQDGSGESTGDAPAPPVDPPVGEGTAPTPTGDADQPQQGPDPAPEEPDEIITQNQPTDPGGNAP